MTSAFWTSWQLWEKLCFVLACAIVVVVLLGCMKLAYNAWSLRRYTKIAAAKVVIKQEMQHSQSVRRGRANMVPFGVRAIESGIEVDGVWISRTNTPANSLPPSPALSAAAMKPSAPHSDSTPDRASTASDMTHIDISQQTRGYREVNHPSSPSSTARNQLDRPARQHEPPPSSDHQHRGRPTYQPRRSSHLRFSNSFDPDDSETLTTLGDRPILTDKKGKRPGGSESEADDGRPSISWSGSSSNSGNDVSNQKPPSGAASNGFLHPKYHRSPRDHKPISYELTDLEPTSVAYGQVNDPLTKISTSSSQGTSDPFATPNESPKEADIARFSLDDDIVDQHAQLMNNNEISYDPSHAQPLQPFDGNRRLRRSQVIRKINSGFEILRPGTLGAPRSNDDGPEWNEESGMGNKREWKKLHKRGRASSKSSYTLEK